MSFNYHTTIRLAVATCSLMLAVAAALKPLPDFVHVCKGNDPRLAECIVHSIESLRPHLAAGIPEMDVPSVEPMDVGSLLLAKRATAQGIQVHASNIQAYNATQYIITNMKVVEHGRLYTFDVAFRTMYVTGTYSVNGQITLLPVTGSGPFTGRFNNIRSQNAMLFGRTIQDDGTEYVSIAKVETNITLGGGNFQLHNLFNGDRVLGDVINDTINQNFLLFANDLMPTVEKALSKLFRRLANRICSNFTPEQLFPAE